MSATWIAFISGAIIDGAIGTVTMGILFMVRDNNGN